MQGINNLGKTKPKERWRHLGGVSAPTRGRSASQVRLVAMVVPQCLTPLALLAPATRTDYLVEVRVNPHMRMTHWRPLPTKPKPAEPDCFGLFCTSGKRQLTSLLGHAGDMKQPTLQLQREGGYLPHLRACVLLKSAPAAAVCSVQRACVYAGDKRGAGGAYVLSSAAKFIKYGKAACYGMPKCACVSKRK
jgi:hypothetical protein